MGTENQVKKNKSFQFSNFFISWLVVFLLLLFVSVFFTFISCFIFVTQNYRDDWISAIEEVSKRLKKEEEKRQSLIEKPKEVQTKTLVSKPFPVKLFEKKIFITNESFINSYRKGM